MRALRVTVTVTLLVAAALTGCLEDGAPGATGPGAQEPPETTATEHGLRLTVAANRSAFAPGEEVNVTFQAENVGDEAVTYRKGCFHEWTVRWINESGDEVPANRPMGVCLGFQETTLEPGESTDEAWVTWNGTLWGDDRYVAAPAGNYTAQVTFTAFDDGGKERRINVTAGVTVQVLEGELAGDGDAPPSNATSGGAVTLAAEPATTVLVPGASAEVTFTATNGRDGAVTYRDGCLQSWEFRVLAPNGSDVSPLLVTCEGFQPASLAPGERTNATYEWDGTMGESGEPAPPGEYTIEGTFLWSAGGERWERVNATATVQVVAD